MTDEEYMREALALAQRAALAGEAPIGAVVVRGQEIIGRGHNSPIASIDPTAHAEILALREALVAARIRSLVFGVRDLRFGGVRSKFRIADSELLNHRVEITEGVLAVECLELLQRFFRERR
ncbi:MAG: nucleoside deaminase [Acidobacteria bacterium]|nr:nucleoside deaminase [Acidobacteriota bacterium]